MEKENLTPAQFVERWLPDFENRRAENHIYSMMSEDGQIFTDVVFPEALAAFEAHIRQETWREACEAQRKECAKAATVERVVIGHNGTHNEFGYVVSHESIINAPIPEIPKNNER